MRFLRIAAALLAALLLTVTRAPAESGGSIYTLLDSAGRPLTLRAGQVYPGDEYISGDNRHYRVISVDEASRTATAEDLGDAYADEATSLSVAAPPALAETDSPAAVSDGKKLICMYSTHSDESYVPDDGDFSLWEDAGIYDVGHALKDELEALGITVVYSEESHLPHDADAYNRSRATAEELLRKAPDALLDIHRDAIPADEYETTVEGEEISKVRLFVGRSNQNAAANKAFALEIKRLADEKYPGLIKDIYIGKGNYNQELYPHALLLELGTDDIEKDKVIGATKYLADVLDKVLFGESAKAAAVSESKPAFTGIAWAIGAALLGAGVYAFASTGRLSGAWTKLKRGASELTGGLFGRKPDK